MHEGTRGIWVTDEVTDEGPAGWATVLPNLFQNVAMAVEVGPNASATTVLAQKVGVSAGTTGAIGLKAAGLAVPALPAEHILIPTGLDARGYVVYDTDLEVLKCWTSNGWRNLWMP